MTWPLCVLILGCVWWVPAIIVCGIAANKQKQAEAAFKQAVADFAGRHTS